MKKIISIILVLVLCLGCCVALSGCSTATPQQAEAAKTSFLAIMEGYNAVVMLKGAQMDITANTTIQEVVDFTQNITNDTYVYEYIDMSLPFLGACQKSANGYYELRTDVDWREFYKA